MRACVHSVGMLCGYMLNSSFTSVVFLPLLVFVSGITQKVVNEFLEAGMCD